MKKRFLLMAAAALLLMTQCRKDEMPAVMPETNTVKMTVTVGPGSKTDITTGGEITWSDGDKLYVGDGNTCIGCLSITQMSDDRKTATFSDNVELNGATNGTTTFHFFYLGSRNDDGSCNDDCNNITWNHQPQNIDNGTTQNTGGETEQQWLHSTSATIDFSSQNITAGDDGKLDGANAFHIGYGSTDISVEDGEARGAVWMTSQVAIAHFEFITPTTGTSVSITSDKTFNKMEVFFNNSENNVKDGVFIFKGVVGDGIKISLNDSSTTNEENGGKRYGRYVMLVPTNPDRTVLTLSCNGGEGEKNNTLTFENGIQANKFYGKDKAIEVDFTK